MAAAGGGGGGGHPGGGGGGGGGGGVPATPICMIFATEGTSFPSRINNI